MKEFLKVKLLSKNALTYLDLDMRFSQCVWYFRIVVLLIFSKHEPKLQFCFIY